MLWIRSPTLFALSTWSFLAFFAWFIVEVVTHGYKDIINLGTGQQPLPLAEQSMQLFMYTTLLTLACLAAQWYADFTRTRASRHMAAAVATFTMVAWFWNLWFVVPAFEGKGDSRNFYCNGTLTSLGRWCHLFQAAAALSVCMEFGIFCTWLWALFYLGTLRTPEIPIPTQATILAPHHSLVAASESGAHNADVAWNTELTEPDDLEQLKIAANNPQTHAPITNRLTVLGHLTNMLSAASVIGWIVLCCSLIDVARDVGLLGWSTQDQPGGTADYRPGTTAPFPSNDRLGDPIVQSNWYWLVLTLGTSIAISFYSSFRRNRAVIGGAMLVSFLSALQWFSLFIYMARRVHQETSDNTQAISWLYNGKNSQYTEVAGAGLIAVAETVRALVLFFRYMTYMLVTKLDHDRVHIPSHVDAPTVVQAERDTYNPNYTNAYGGTNAVNTQDYTSAHQTHAHRPVTEMNVPGPSYDAADADLYVPSYNMGIFHGSSALFRIIFMLQVLSVLTFWVLQIVYQSKFGLFNGYQSTGPEAPAANQYSFAGAEAPERGYYYNEYQFLLTTLLVLGAWVPAFHAEREVSVSSAVAACYSTMLMCLGFFLLIWTFAYESIYSNGTLYAQICVNESSNSQWCNMTQAGGVLALINGFFLLCIFLHCMGRLAERRMLITTWENSVQNVPGLLAPLIVIGICIWSFTQLYIGLFTVGLTHQFQDNNGLVQNNPVESYFASQAFLTFVTCAFAVWCGVYSSKLMYAWQSWSWRMAALFSSMAAAAFLIPLLIYASRFIHNGGLNHADKALVSAIIILAGGTTFYFASFLFLVHTSFYAAGPAGAAIPPTGMALKQNQQFIANKQQGVAVERDLEMGAVTGVSQYQTNSTVVQTAEPVVNPRTGETVVAVEQHPIAEETVVTQPQPVVYQTQPVGLAAPTGVVYSSGPQTVQYHDY